MPFFVPNAFLGAAGRPYCERWKIYHFRTISVLKFRGSQSPALLTTKSGLSSAPLSGKNNPNARLQPNNLRGPGLLLIAASPGNSFRVLPRKWAVAFARCSRAGDPTLGRLGAAPEKTQHGQVSTHVHLCEDPIIRIITEGSQSSQENKAQKEGKNFFFWPA